MADADPENPGADHPLDSVAGLPPEWLAALKVRWITTAEQALAISVFPEGRAGLEETLPPNAPKLDDLLAILAQAVGAARAAQLQKPATGGALGVTLPDDVKKKFEINPP